MFRRPRLARSSQRIADFQKRPQRTRFAAQPIGRIEDAIARTRQVLPNFNAHPPQRTARCASQFRFPGRWAKLSRM